MILFYMESKFIDLSDLAFKLLHCGIYKNAENILHDPKNCAIISKALKKFNYFSPARGLGGGGVLVVKN